MLKQKEPNDSFKNRNNLNAKVQREILKIKGILTLPLLPPALKGPPQLLPIPAGSGGREENGPHVHFPDTAQEGTPDRLWLVCEGGLDSQPPVPAHTLAPLLPFFLLKQTCRPQEEGPTGTLLTL